MYQNLALLAAFLLTYSIFAGRFESRLLNGPLMFMLAGLILGPAFLGILQPRIDSHGLRILAELTLAIVLFSDAANADLKVLKAHEGLPLRLLLIGLPLTMLSGWLLGIWLFPQAPLIELALLAILLAPTDAALGKAVVSNPKVAAPVREGLNVESGLNDGICVPVLLMFLALLIEEHTQSPLSLAIELFFEELGIGALIGGTLTFMAWLMQRYSGKHHWQTPMWSQLTLPGLAVLCFATAQTLGGSGFIAAFVGGLLASYLFAEQKHDLLKASEEFASLLSIITWVVFGALVIPSVWSSFTVDVWLYALLSLTVIRIVPVLVSLAGTGFDFETRLFIGWFGPRGLASIVFAIMILDYPLQTGRTLVAVAACTVLLSVLLHGLSANPWVSRLANRIN
ncbi:sodium:proton antiporter [Pseudomonas fluorescens]|jgi:NhaP-type Na+/H+ or K+/H+ antiporter|uniref:cation:proton antiporter n=1 Tax=Pseudomonas atacamensis TaxID=2565368 RepID=UPI0008B922D4|nr:cation:proton antiporter [Pseudomonas atacamensis]OFJ44440.1 sodium:proton antiporter [Pseudomonas koreensis]RON73788.1 sodium:proton antiporter [Pseudomonas fluorescens]ROO06381.1 sodium:proton antiporter [Pseudomonas fluorescens]ROO15891.1 sodium:proton antiporter [Pseudomonas fluorescens]